MKNLLYPIISLFAPFAAGAQPLTPMFTMPIWFEDAIGKKDTIWVGTDTAASYFNINSQFGEIEIIEPFDSVFEVRGVHANDQNWRTSKIIIEGNSNGGVCLLPARTRIMIHSLNWPITIHWDTMLLKQISPCHKNVILTPTSLTFILQHWFESDTYYCMMRTDSLQEDFIYEQEPVYQGWLLQHSFEVQGQGLTEINGLYYSGFSGPPYCYTLLDASAPTQASSSVNVFPNPAPDGKATVAFAHPEWVAAVTLSEAATGRTVQVPSQSPSDKWELPAATPGVNFLTVWFSDGSRTVRKVVVY